MQKVKHGFQLANKDISSGNVYMVQNCFTLFDSNLRLKFKLSTAYNTLNERNEILKGQLKTTTICVNWKDTAGVFDP